MYWTQLRIISGCRSCQHRCFGLWKSWTSSCRKPAAIGECWHCCRFRYTKRNKFVSILDTTADSGLGITSILVTPTTTTGPSTATSSPAPNGTGWSSPGAVAGYTIAGLAVAIIACFFGWRQYVYAKRADRKR